MRFDVVQRYAAPIDQVLDAYLDPGFYASIEGSDKIGTPEVVGIERHGDTATVRLRMRLVADLPPAATAVIDPRKLSWVEHTDYDLAARTSRTQLHPDHYGERLTASAHSIFAPEGDDRTRRTTDGVLTVRMRLVGGRVERVIVGDLTAHLTAETGWLESYLAGQASS